MKILVIRFGAIGDIVLTSPVLRCLKKQLPGAEVHFLVKPSYFKVIEHNRYVDKIHLFLNTGISVLDFREEGYDAIVDLQNDEESRQLTKELGVKAYSYKKYTLRKNIFKKLKWNLMPRQHLAERFLEAVAPLGIKNDGAGLDFFIPESEEVTDRDIPASHHLGYIAIVIGASFFTKRMPVYKFQELVKAIDHPLMLLGGKEASEDGFQISAIDPVKIYNACGKFSLNESADLLRRSRLVITHDTGLMHMAAALKKPIISIWGSTTPSFGMSPYYGSQHLQRLRQPDDLVQVRGLWCRPCTETGREKCPLGHFKCMHQIALEELIEKINKRLSRS